MLAVEVGGLEQRLPNAHQPSRTYDTLLNDFNVFFEEDIPDLLQQLDEAEIIVGYNLIQFDCRVLSHDCEPEDLIRFKGKTFDILAILDMPHRVRLAKHTFNGNGKTTIGKEAVNMFRQGLYEDLEKYCKKDVAITRKLFCLGARGKPIKYLSKHGEKHVDTGH